MQRILSQESNLKLLLFLSLTFSILLNLTQLLLGPVKNFLLNPQNIELSKILITVLGNIMQTTIPALIVSTVAFLFYKKVLRNRQSIETETKLLKDILFFRKIISHYVEQNKSVTGKSQLSSFRSETSKELGYDSSEASQPARIEKRLVFLGATTKEIDDVLVKLKQLKL